MDDLRRLVGPGEPIAPARTDDEQDAERLYELVGGDRSARRAHDAREHARVDAQRAETQELAELVGGRGVGIAANPVSFAAVESAEAGGRPRKVKRVGSSGVDWITFSIAGVAVLTVIAVIAVAIAVRNGPVDDAAASLREQEAGVVNNLSTLATSVTNYDGAVQAGVTLAADAKPVLEALQGRAGAGQLGAASASLAAFEAALAEQPVLAALPTYERRAGALDSLESVARALDTVSAVGEKVERATEDVRIARASVDASTTAFRDALRSLGTSLLPEADVITSQNTSAAASFRTAVTDGAKRVISDQATGAPGFEAMRAYATAVDALRAENERVVEEGATRATRAPVYRAPVRTPTQPTAPVDPAPEPQPEPEPEPTPVDPLPEQPPTGG